LRRLDLCGQNYNYLQVMMVSSAASASRKEKVLSIYLRLRLHPWSLVAGLWLPCASRRERQSNSRLEGTRLPTRTKVARQTYLGLGRER
jgi:hypothetical protein